MDRADRGPARLSPTDRRCGSRSSCATASPMSSRLAGCRRPTSSSPTRETTATSCCSSTRPASRAGARRARRGWTTISFGRCCGARSGTRCARTGCRPTRFVRAGAPGAATRAGRADRARAHRPAGPRSGGVSRTRGAARVSSPRWSACCRAARDDRTLPYGVRKAYSDGFIGLAASPDGVAALDSLLDADSVAGEPLRDPTRWNTVTRLLELGAPSAEPRYAQQERRDTTPDGRRRAFIAGAGRPSAESSATTSHAGSPTPPSTRNGPPGASARSTRWSTSADLPVAPAGARFAALHPGTPPDLLPGELARGVSAGADHRLGARRGPRVAARPPPSARRSPPQGAAARG